MVQRPSAGPLRPSRRVRRHRVGPTRRPQRRDRRRRLAAGLLSLLILLGLVLTFSKGALLLGVPAGLLVVFWVWQRRAGRRTWPWVAGAAVGGVAAEPLLLRLIPGDELEAALDATLDGVDALSDWQGSSDYRRAMALVLSRRALDEAAA